MARTNTRPNKETSQVHESKQNHSWVPIGTTYGAVVSERIVALVYHARERRGEVGGPGGNGAVAEPAWFLVWTDEPHRHFQLSAPPGTAGMSREELEQASYVALAEAGEVIDAKLSGEPATET